MEQSNGDVGFLPCFNELFQQGAAQTGILQLENSKTFPREPENKDQLKGLPLKTSALGYGL